MQLKNISERAFQIGAGKDLKTLVPGAVLELPNAEAGKLLKRFPKELVALAKEADVSKAKAAAEAKAKEEAEAAEKAAAEAAEKNGNKA